MNRIGEVKYNNFGSKMIITQYKNYNDIDVYFPEYNWTLKHSYYCSFKRGSIRCPYERRFSGVGYLGEGDAPVSKNCKYSKEFVLWREMINRCYNDIRQEIQPRYKECSVCDEWHNYNKFYEWYKDNYYNVPNQRMCVDKDILCKGNKIYSPENCVLVPQCINNLFLKREAMRGKYPIGVSYHKGNREFQAKCNNEYKESVDLGSFNNPIDAFNEYKRFKELTIKKVADLYKDLIPKKLYDALYKYEVEITD